MGLNAICKKAKQVFDSCRRQRLSLCDKFVFNWSNSRENLFQQIVSQWESVFSGYHTPTSMCIISFPLDLLAVNLPSVVEQSPTARECQPSIRKQNKMMSHFLFSQATMARGARSRT